MLVLKTLIEMVLLVGALILVIVYNEQITRFFRWLKGSRTSYYISPHNDICRTSVSIRTVIDAARMTHRVSGNVIEIDRGPFRRRSKIYKSGDDRYYPIYWKVVGDWKNLDDDVVCLGDIGGIKVEDALRTIKKYQSLQSVLDRIAELETKLAASERQRKNKLAAIKAALRLINADRNQYRSKTSKRIRKWLEAADRSTDPGEIWPSPDQIQKWIDGLSKVTEEKV